ncbi:hypothetical protein [Nitrosomonas communis]|uniref:PepSY domain-containing protein n=1 Tax=Nitrosomonas communis TaxID=44574 RepID=A0A1I4VF82_9PROT|nr:hypothetical protein [Nitrosomonas communis]SFM99743.1 hypothetical protein SAMN05421863_108114 [Nitrosomonas communis]
MNVKILVLITLMVLFFVTSSSADVLDENVPLFQVPEKAQHAIKEHSQNGMIENIEKRTMKKKVIIYKAKVIKPDGKIIEVTVEEDGTFVETQHSHKPHSHRLKLRE